MRQNLASLGPKSVEFRPDLVTFGRFRTKVNSATNVHLTRSTAAQIWSKSSIPDMLWQKWAETGTNAVDIGPKLVDFGRLRSNVRESCLKST